MVRLPVPDDTFASPGTGISPGSFASSASRVQRSSFLQRLRRHSTSRRGTKRELSIEGIQLPSAKPMDGGIYRSHGGRRTARRSTGKTIEDDEDGACRQRVGLVETRGMVRRMWNTHIDTVYTPESVLLRAESDPLRS